MPFGVLAAFNNFLLSDLSEAVTIVNALHVPNGRAWRLMYLPK